MISVNKNIQPEAERLLEYLQSNSGRRIILGQHTQTMRQEELQYIHGVTGEYPALCGFELLAYSPNINFSDLSEECLREVREAEGTLAKAWEWAKAGGIVTFTWHWFSPIGGRDKSFFSCNTDFNAARAIPAVTNEHKAFVSDMDYMAGLLKPFCDAHIPILWRPFHECEGDWFWWGKCHHDVVRKLYRMMYERYTERFHLNNLIWVFNSTLAESYPGDDVVDILTCDMYPPEHEHTACLDKLKLLFDMTPAQKLMAIGETGTIPDVREITENGVPWSWFMTWSKEFCMSEKYTTNEVLKAAYENENAVTLGRFLADGTAPMFPKTSILGAGVGLASLPTMEEMEKLDEDLLSDFEEEIL